MTMEGCVLSTGTAGRDCLLVADVDEDDDEGEDWAKDWAPAWEAAPVEGRRGLKEEPGWRGCDLEALLLLCRTQG